MPTAQSEAQHNGVDRARELGRLKVDVGRNGVPRQAEEQSILSGEADSESEPLSQAR